jgi:hypothetical protein
VGEEMRLALGQTAVKRRARRCHVEGTAQDARKASQESDPGRDVARRRDHVVQVHGARLWNKSPKGKGARTASVLSP